MLKEQLHNQLGTLEKEFVNFRQKDIGEGIVLDRLESREKKMREYLWPWIDFSRDNGSVYPSQGLLRTEYDDLEASRTVMLPPGELIDILRHRTFFLMMFNHPYRMHFLREVNRKAFQAPQRVPCLAIDVARARGEALSIGDIGSEIVPPEKGRMHRTELYAQGPFVKLGRQARSIFVGSASPDVWNSSFAISTMAASHCLAGIPRNGVLSDIQRQADVASETFDRLDDTAELVLAGRPDAQEILAYWEANVMGVLEGSAEKALVRATKLYNVGVRTFRVYSPEPGAETSETVSRLKQEFGRDIEVFTGQIVNVSKAKSAEEAGADGIFVGIGGGGRCITGVRSGSVIDWPKLIWDLRGEIGIPIVVEGGASDHVAVTMLLGASGIGVSRIVSGGTIESPGGALYYIDSKGKMYKPYGGEASARTKALDGKLLPFGIPAFVEGETTKAEMSFIAHAKPTLTYNLHLLSENAILALVFRGRVDIAGLQAIDPSPLRKTTQAGEYQQKTH